MSNTSWLIHLPGSSQSASRLAVQLSRGCLGSLASVILPPVPLPVAGQVRGPYKPGLPRPVRPVYAPQQLTTRLNKGPSHVMPCCCSPCASCHAAAALTRHAMLLQPSHVMLCCYSPHASCHAATALTRHAMLLQPSHVMPCCYSPHASCHAATAATAPTRHAMLLQPSPPPPLRATLPPTDQVIGHPRRV